MKQEKNMIGKEKSIPKITSDQEWEEAEMSFLSRFLNQGMDQWNEL